MAKRLGLFVVLCVAAVLSARPACAIIVGIDNDQEFRNPGSYYHGMNWDYVYPTPGGTSVAIGYFTLLTAAHYPLDPCEPLLIHANGDEFEVVSQILVPPDSGEGLPPDLRVLKLRNNTNPLRPLPGFYRLYMGEMEAGLSQNMVLVGTGYSGAVCNIDGYDFFREDPSTGRAKRWGTNGFSNAAPAEFEGRFNTNCFRMGLDPGATPHESGIAHGDSGGGVFVKTAEGDWRLAGISLYREGMGPWYYNTWAASIPAYADWLKSVLRHDVLPGDTDLDGDVDVTDYLRIKASLGETQGSCWRYGDFDLDGDVDRDDYRAILVNFGYGFAGHPDMVAPTPPGGEAGELGATVPEPTVLGLLAACALGWLRPPSRRRRQESVGLRPD